MLFFSSAGNVRHPPVLFLHGFMGSSQDFEPVVETLSSSFWCLCFDLPAHGFSIFPLTTSLPELILNQIIATLDHLRVPFCHLVGYSMGGRIALYLKNRFPSRFGSLILFSSHPGLGSEREREQRFLSDLKWCHLIDDFPNFLSKWYSQIIFEKMNPRAMQKRFHAPRYGLKHYLEHLSLAKQPNFWQSLKDTTLICGAFDQTYMELYQKKAQSFHVIAAASHAILEDNPNESTNLIRNILCKKH